MGKKSTQAEFELKLAEVVALVISGHTRSDIVRHAAKNWSMASRQVDTYLSYANKEIQEINRADYKKNLAIALRALWKDYRTAERHADKLGFLKQIAHLQGLGTINVHVKENRDLIEKTENELDALISSDEIEENDSGEEEDY